MAEQPEFLKAVDEFYLDKDAVEVFVNSDENTDVNARLGATYPTLQKAVAEIYKRGGIAERFKTLVDLQASDLTDGQYALVADDTDDKNGIYIKESGAWFKSKLDINNIIADSLLSISSPSGNLYNDPYHYNPAKYWLSKKSFDVQVVSGRRMLVLSYVPDDFGKRFNPSDFPNGVVSVNIRVHSKTAATKTGVALFYLLQYSSESEPDRADEVAREEFVFSSEAINTPQNVKFENVKVLDSTKQIRLFCRVTDGSVLTISDVYIGDSKKAVIKNNYKLDTLPTLTLAELDNASELNEVVLSGSPTKGQIVSKDAEYGKYLTKDGHSVVSEYNPLSMQGWYRVFNASAANLSMSNVVKSVTDLSDGLEYKALSKTAGAVKVNDSIDFSNDNSVFVKNYDKLELSEPTYIKLPLAAGSASPYEGFVCTGLDRDSDGYWIAGNDGRGENAPDVSSVVVLSHDFSTVVEEYPIRGEGGLVSDEWFSVQGVAWDSSDNTIWAADKAGDQIIHIDRTTGQLIDDAISTPFAPNGIAYDLKLDAIYASDENDSKVYLYSCVDGSLIKTLPFRTGSDQLHFDSENRILYCSYGGNGSSGFIYGLDVETVESVFWYTGDVVVERSESIEGIYFTDKYLYVLNDGGFHKNARPALNRVLRYEYKNKPVRKHTSKIGCSVVYSPALSIKAATALVTHGEPINDKGFGFYVPNISPYNALRLIINPVSSNRLIVDLPPPPNVDATWIVASLFVDLETKELRGFVNSIEVTPIVASGDINNTAGLVEVERLKVGGVHRNPNIHDREFKGRISSLVLFDDVSDINSIDDYHNKHYGQALIK